MQSNKRPENMERITTAALAEQFIAQQVADIQAQVGKPKMEVNIYQPDPAFAEEVRSYARDKVEWSLDTFDRYEREARSNQVKEETVAHFAEAYPEEDGEGQLKTLDIVPVPDGVTKGYLVGASFKDAKGNTVEYNEITKQNRLSVAAVEGPASIYLEGGVRYYSEGAILEGDRIQTPEEGICYLVFQ